MQHSTCSAHGDKLLTNTVLEKTRMLLRCYVWVQNGYDRVYLSAIPVQLTGSFVTV